MTELETALYVALKMYPCRCVYARTTSGQPLFKEGVRVLEKQCSRCVACALYDTQYPHEQT
jgi:hypothetical protein